MDLNLIIKKQLEKIIENDYQSIKIENTKELFQKYIVSFIQDYKLENEIDVFNDIIYCMINKFEKSLCYTHDYTQLALLRIFEKNQNINNYNINLELLDFKISEAFFTTEEQKEELFNTYTKEYSIIQFQETQENEGEILGSYLYYASFKKVKEYKEELFHERLLNYSMNYQILFEKQTLNSSLKEKNEKNKHIKL